MLGVVRLSVALDELLVADRDALGIEGELEQNWSDLEAWVRHVGGRFGSNRRTLRKADLEDAVDRLGIVRARIESTAAPDRPMPSCPAIVAVKPERLIGTWTHAYLDLLLDAFAEVHALRAWARTTHRAWAPETPTPFSELEPFETADVARRAELGRSLPAFNRRRPAQLIVFAVALLAFIALVVRAKLTGH